MKNITAVLSEEHKIILRTIDKMLTECEQIENGKMLEKAFFENLIDLIKNYADRYHHAKEENILFKMMLENSANLHCNPIPVMLYEHDTGRQYVKGMEDELNGENQEKLNENARGYGYLLQEHIYKEDSVLYPMAKEALNDSQKDLLLEKYKEAETGEFTEENI